MSAVTWSHRRATRRPHGRRSVPSLEWCVGVPRAATSSARSSPGGSGWTVPSASSGASGHGSDAPSGARPTGCGPTGRGGRRPGNGHAAAGVRRATIVPDASSLLVAINGFWPRNDPRLARLVRATIAALEQGAFLRRYPPHDDGFMGMEGASSPLRGGRSALWRSSATWARPNTGPTRCADASLHFNRRSGMSRTMRLSATPRCCGRTPSLPEPSTTCTSSGSDAASGRSACVCGERPGTSAYRVAASMLSAGTVPSAVRRRPSVFGVDAVLGSACQCLA